MLAGMSPLQIIGRRSSLFTRMPLLFAEELRVPYELVPVYDMTALGPEVYAGNPALKLPILRQEGRVLFGSQNICRALWELRDRQGAVPKRVVWPENLPDDRSRNAQELVWHCMNTQVQLIMGTMVNQLPPENPFFAKARASFEGSLRWLDAQLASLPRAPGSEDLELFDISLYCLIDHLVFRGTLPLEPYPALARFRDVFSQRASAQRTTYRYDVKVERS
jgi:glutathione S-transferase